MATGNLDPITFYMEQSAWWGFLSMVVSKGNFTKFLEVMQTAWGNARKYSSPDPNGAPGVGLVQSSIVELDEDEDDQDGGSSPPPPPSSSATPQPSTSEFEALQARLAALEASNRNLQAERERVKVEAARETRRQQAALDKLVEAEKIREQQMSDLQHEAKSAHDLAEQAAVAYITEHFQPPSEPSTAQKSPSKKADQSWRRPRPKRNLPVFGRVEALLGEILRGQTPPPTSDQSAMGSSGQTSVVLATTPQDGLFLFYLNCVTSSLMLSKQEITHCPVPNQVNPLTVIKLPIYLKWFWTIRKPRRKIPSILHH